MGRPFESEIVTGEDIVLVVLSNDELPDGVCRALWIGTAGNLNITLPNGEDRTDVPAQAGLFPIRCRKQSRLRRRDCFRFVV